MVEAPHGLARARTRRVGRQEKSRADAVQNPSGKIRRYDIFSFFIIEPQNFMPRTLFYIMFRQKTEVPDVVNVIIFLLGADMVNGVTLPVDGGFLCSPFTQAKL